MCHLGLWRAANTKWTTLFPLKHYLEQSFTYTQRAWNLSTCVQRCSRWVERLLYQGTTEVASVRRCQKHPPRPTQLKPVSCKTYLGNISNHNSTSGITHLRWGKSAGTTTATQEGSKNRWEEQLCVHQGQWRSWGGSPKTSVEIPL